MSTFNGVKTFVATMYAQRQVLGETVSQWLADARRRPGFEVVDIVVRQSSDAQYHAVSIVVFYVEGSSKKKAAR